VIIRYNAGNWSITEVRKLEGSQSTQIITPQGNFLSAVTTDQATIIGSGTAGDPILTNPNYLVLYSPDGTKFRITIDDDGILTTTEVL
jgi:hypothetical protein